MALPRVGRFTVIEAIGDAASPTEFAAYDPDLDRRVTIRVLPTGDETGLESARVVSRLVNPHVEAIHQVGHEGELAYVAAEHVSGQPLDAWIAEQPVPAVARCLMHAAQALRIAHEAGVAHGRLTSGAILVDEDGEPKLVGFGFADEQSSPHDDRAALYAVFRASLADTATPPWLDAALERAPELQTFERELAAQLERPRTARGQSLAVVGLAAGVVLLAWPRDEAEAPERGQPCTDGSEELAVVWGPQRQREIEDAFEATGERGQRLMWNQVRTRMGAWSSEWSDALVASCEATRVLRNQSEELHELRMVCLMQLRDQAAVLSDALTLVNPASIGTLTSRVYQLPEVERCRSRDGLDFDGVDLSSSVVREIAGQLGLARAKAQVSKFDEAEALLTEAAEEAERAEVWRLASEAHRSLATFADRRGELEQAEALAEETLGYAERSGDPTEIVWAWHRLGEIAQHAGRGDESTFYLERATAIAEGYDVGDDVWVGLLTMRAQARFATAHPSVAADDYLEAARLVEHLGMDPALGLQAMYDAIPPLVHAGRVDEAESVGERGLERAREMFGPGHMLASAIRMQLAQLALQKGDLERALQLSKRALDDLSPNHPYSVQMKLGAVGIYAHTLHRQGKTEEAVPKLQEVLDEVSAKLGEGDPILAATQTFLGDMLVEQGRAAEAVALLEGVVSGATGHPLTDPMNLASYRLALAQAQAEAGQPEAAAETVDAVLSADAKGVTEQSNSWFATLVAAGEVLMKIDARDRAREVFLRARPIMEAAEVDPVNKQIVIDSLAELEAD